MIPAVLPFPLCVTVAVCGAPWGSLLAGRHQEGFSSVELFAHFPGLSPVLHGVPSPAAAQALVTGAGPSSVPQVHTSEPALWPDPALSRLKVLLRTGPAGVLWTARDPLPSSKNRLDCPLGTLAGHIINCLAFDFLVLICFLFSLLS